jgi:hypothetical protein
MSTLIGNITWAKAIRRINRRIMNGYPSIASTLSDNEIEMYLIEAIATVMVQETNAQMQFDGVRSVPEGFITTYTITTFPKDVSTGLYKITLPHPPIGLPLGLSIISPYFAKNGTISAPLIAIHSNQRGTYRLMPSPNFGAYYWVENSTMYIDSNGADVTILGTLYLPMPSPRPATNSDSDLINLPDEAMSAVFDICVQKLTARLQTPMETTNSGVPIANQKG